MVWVGSGWSGGRGAFNLVFLRATAPGVPREAGLAVLDAPVGPEFLALVLTLPALLLGPVLLAVGLRRARLAGWWPLCLWVVGIGTFLATEFTVKAGEIAGIGLAAAGLALIGHAVDHAPGRAGNGPSSRRSGGAEVGGIRQDA